MTNTLDLNIWGRNFTLPVKYDCYKGEEVTETQEKAITDFCNQHDWIESSKHQVEEYCRDYVIEDNEIDKKDNVFSYVKPEYLFVKREDNPRILIVCKYRYDLEHGLAVVFSPDGSITVGSQDIIL